MSKVSDLRSELLALLDESGMRAPVVKELLTELATHEHMEIRELWRRIGYEPRTTTRKKPFDRAAAVERLGKAFSDDDRFRAELGALLADKAASKDELIAIYSAMYAREKSFPSKATRGNLVQEISDERNLLVRAHKTAKFLSGTS